MQIVMYSSELNFREVPKSIIFILANGLLKSSSKFSGFKSLYIYFFFFKKEKKKKFTDGQYC